MRFLQRGQVDLQAEANLLEAGYLPLLAHILAMRGVKDHEQASAFLSPTISALHDPFLMTSMQAVVDLITSTIQEGKRIVVFGDYDVDGVTATAALLSHLRSMGAKANYYLPDRHGEGYGLNETSIRSLAGSYDLMITVDCGITALHEVQIAKELGLFMIITDHHEPLATLPDCLCINPKIGYPCKDLCGAGVVGKLIQALSGLEALLEVIDLVALGTIADIVPLLGENRILATLGLQKINKNIRPGIAALVEVSSLHGKELTAGHISFLIAPRINAGGRMGHSGKSVDMMLETDKETALDTARELDDLNKERQRQEQEIYQSAMEQALQENLHQARCLVIEGQGWNAGVIGIVASRLVEKFSRPVFLLSRDGDLCVGSGRSIPGVHLFVVLDAIKQLFVRYGGHEMAAGLTIKAERVSEFKRCLQDKMEELRPEIFLPTSFYDVSVSLDQIDTDLAKALDALAPTGQGNPMPIFYLQNVVASNARVMGVEGAHLRFVVSDKQRSCTAIAFKMGERLRAAQGAMDVLASIEVDSFSGYDQVKLMVRNFIPATVAFSTALQQQGDHQLLQYIESLPMLSAKTPGFRRHIPLKSEQHVKETILTMLEQSPGGVLIACALPDTATRLDAWLSSIPVGEMVTRRIGELLVDPSAPHTLCCIANNQGEPLAHYRQIIFPDGVWSNQWVESLQEQAPMAAIYAPAIGEHVVSAMQKIVPSVDRIRLLYRFLRTRALLIRGLLDFSSLVKLTQELSIGETSLSIALHMLSDMDLCSYTNSPFSLLMAQEVTGFREIEKTPTYEFFKNLGFIQN